MVSCHDMAHHYMKDYIAKGLGDMQITDVTEEENIT